MKLMNSNSEYYLNQIIHDDCRRHIHLLPNDSIDLFLSDIPYGISTGEWDVLHENTNSALLGQSPSQVGKSAFKRRGKPINGWSKADRNIGKEYEEWCNSWAGMLSSKMKTGSSLFIFGARRTLHHVINAFENAGFLLKDVLIWKKETAHQRAQRLSIVYERRGMHDAAEEWQGWRIGNLAPIYEPIAWFIKPYRIGGTIADNILEHGVGAINLDEFKKLGFNPTNILEFSFMKEEDRIHEAQKPLELFKFLIKLTTKAGQVVLDPFMGSGTTAVACILTNRHYIGFEKEFEFYSQSMQRLKKLEKDTSQFPLQEAI